MRQINSTDFKNHLGEFLGLVRDETLIVSKSGKRLAVVMSAEEYEHLHRLEDAYWIARAHAAEARGDLILANLSGKGYEEKCRAHVVEATYPYEGLKFAWAAPAYADRCIFARSDKELVCASLAE